MSRKRRSKSKSSSPPAAEASAETTDAPKSTSDRSARRPSKQGGRRKWNVLDAFLVVVLLASLSWLGWEIRRAYFRGDGAGNRPTRPADAGDLCARLAGKGDVLALGRDALPQCASEGFRLVTPVEVTADGRLDQILSARDDAAVADLLAEKNIRHVVVSTTLANPSLLPKVTVRNRLALYKPSERFHALYLTEAAGLYEIVPGMLQVSDAEGAELVRIARAAFAGAEYAPADLPGIHAQGDFEVAVELQGLRPVPRPWRPRADARNRREHVRHIRRNLFTATTGETLAGAARAAGEKLRRRWAERAEEENGPIEQALPRLTIEVEVMYDRTDVRTYQPDGAGGTQYASFLWRAIDLGLHGIALERGTDRYRYRLPSDAVYSGRKKVEDLLAKACEDLLATDDDALRELLEETDVEEGTSATEASKVAYRADPNLHVQRFRTHHFRETTPGGDVIRLARGIPPVPLTAETTSRANLQRHVLWATRWLTDSLQPNGQFRYLYRPEQDYYLSDMQIEEQYNGVRHGLATYALFMSHREHPDPALWDAAERSLRWILGRVVFGPAWMDDPERRARLPSWVRTDTTYGPVRPDGGAAPATEWRCPDGDVRVVPPDMAYVHHLRNAKMGNFAAATLAISEMIFQTPEAERAAKLEEYRPFLEGFANFALFMQHTSGPRAGAMDHYFVSPDHGHYRRTTTIYPGEILFGLARIYRLTHDPRIPPAYAMAHRWEKAYFDRESVIREPDGTYENRRRADLVQFVPWVSMAHNDMYIALRDEDPAMAREYADFGIAVSDWVAQVYLFDENNSFYPEYLGGYFKWEFELPAMHSMVYTEGTAAAFNLAKMTGDPRMEYMRMATVVGCRFAIQQIVVPGVNDHFMPNPARALGGVRFGINVSEMRTDYSYHTLSALNQTLRYMTDEELRP